MLQLCRSCSRHVKSSPCPFCGHGETSAVRTGPRARLSRAQLVASVVVAGAVAGVMATGCGDDDSEFGDGDGGYVDPGLTSSGAIYGGPPFDAGSSSGSSSGAIYGGPPVEDASSESDDAGDDASADAADGGN